MANTSIAIELWLKAKDTASSALAGVGKAIRFLDSEVSVFSGKIRESFNGLFGGGLDGAMEFEAQLSKVAAKGGYTTAEMATLKKAATDIGAQFGVTGTEAAQGMEALAAAGLSAADAMKGLPPVLALAKAEGITMDSAAEKLSDSLSVMGLGFEHAGRMADVLAKGANISTTSASALAVALSTAGGIATTAGMSLEQTVGALSALASAGIKGEKAGTALQAILTQLVNPASQASKELSALGITSRDLGTVIGQLASKGNANNAAILAFGETAGPGLRALIGQGQQAVAGLTGQLSNSKGAAEEAANGIGNNLKGALSALQSTWTNVKTALFDPVLEPLTKQAKELSSALNKNLASGALKPAQTAIRAFADTAIASARDFMAGFDFQVALKNIQNFASSAGQAFTDMRDSGKAAADVVTLSWNTLASGFRTIGASLLSIAGSAVATLANMEAAASRIGLGSQQRANELRETAIGLGNKAAEMIAGVNANAENMGNAFRSLTEHTKGAAGETKNLATAQQALNAAAPAVELQSFIKTLDEYRGSAERANAAAAKARQEYESGKISAADYSKVLLTASDANAALANAVDKQTSAQKDASPTRKRTATELEAEAKATLDTAGSYGDYTSAIEQTGDAQADALRADIALASAKRDSYTVVLKTVELAKLEAATADRVATAKNQEVTELQKAVAAQQAYLDSVSGGTQAQQKEMEILQLKLAALQAEAEQAGKTAQAKVLAAQQVALQSIQIQQVTDTTNQNTDATEKNTDAQKKSTEAIDDGGSAISGQWAKWGGLTESMSDATHQMFLAIAQQNLWNFGMNQGADAIKTYKKELAGQTEGIQNANAAIADLTAQLQQSELSMMRQGQAAANISRATESIENAGIKAALAYQKQRLELENLLYAVEQGEGGVQQLNKATHYADTAFNLLGDEDLSRLRAAIADAKSKMDDLRQASADALDEAQRALLQQQGNDLALAELDHKRTTLDLQKQLNTAQAAGDKDAIANLQQALQLQEQVYNLKAKEIQQAAQTREREKATASSPTTAVSSPAPTKTYQLDLVGTNGRTFTATTTMDPSAFLDELETAKRRSMSL